MTHDSLYEPEQDFGYRITERLVNAFHPEEMKYMPYEIGQMYQIGADRYMIGGPQYAIGAPMQGLNLAMQPRMAPQAPMAVQMMPQPTLVSKVDPTQARLQPLGCNIETNVAVGTTGTATTSPQKVYKPERFVVPATVAPDFLIAAIFIGVALQSPASTAISAEAFLPDSIYSNVDFDTCQISQQIQVQARNRGGADRPFFSTFYGRALQ